MDPMTEYYSTLIEQAAEELPHVPQHNLLYPQLYAAAFHMRCQQTLITKLFAQLTDQQKTQLIVS